MSKHMGTNGSLGSVADQLDRKGTLSPRQLDAVQKCIKRPVAKGTAVDVAQLIACFERATAAGLIRRKLNVFGFVFTEAPATGKNAGHFYVKYDDTYLGKIKRADGQFFKVKACTDTEAERVAEILSDLDNNIIASGKETGICCCCSRQLTNSESIELGIGPICREKWGF